MCIKLIIVQYYTKIHGQQNILKNLPECIPSVPRDLQSPLGFFFELKNVSNCELRNELHRFYQDVLCLQIVTQFYSTTVNVILATLVRIMTFRVIIFMKLADALHLYLHIFCNFTHIEKNLILMWIEIDLHPSVMYGIYEMIYTNLTNTQHILVDISRFQFYPYRKKNVEKRGNFSLTPLIKV